jgi:hypothetical protein
MDLKGYKHRKYTIKDFKNIVNKFDGYIFTNEKDDYRIRVCDKIKCKCKFGHIFYKSYSKLKLNRWCSECRSSISEEIVRSYFEDIFQTKFKKIRPKNMLGPKGYPLELDGYNSDLMIAFEHNGEQHYKNIFTNDRLPDRIKNDAAKLAYCIKNNIKLIIIPDLYNILGVNNLIDFINKECIKQNIIIPNPVEQLNIEYKNFYSHSKLNELQYIAKVKGGTLLSSYYIGWNNKLKWKCAKGHEWETTPAHIKGRGQWCRKCFAKSNDFNIDEFKKLYYEDGFTYKQIANKINVSVGTICNFFKKHNLKKKKYVKK